MSSILVIGGGPVCLRALTMIRDSSQFTLQGYIPASRLSEFNQVCIEFAQKAKIRIINISHLSSLDVDLVLSIGNSFIFDEKICSTIKILNFHAAPLPKYRGSACPSFAILNGDKNFGFCYHFIAPGLDSGPIVLQKTFPIPDNITAFDLDSMCISYGLDHLEGALTLSSSSGFVASPQSQHSIQTFKPYKRSSLDKFRFIGLDKLNHPSSLVKIRALTWPQVLDPCYTYLHGKKILLTYPIALVS